MPKGKGKGTGLGAGLIDPKFCCCAVPLVNAGIYAILAEQAILGVCIGTIVLTTPDVVGASFPSFASVIFAITCFVVTLVQPIGFVGVLREKTSTFKVYSLINALAVTAAFSTAAALIITSALRHQPAVALCKTNFFTVTNETATSAFSDAANSTLTEEGDRLCSPFVWADVGIMGGLWLLLLIVQAYFIYITRTYSTSQVKDHKLYHSVYSENPEAFTMSILRSTRYNPNSTYRANSMYSTAPPPGRSDPWDARPSMDSGHDQYSHPREFSDGPLVTEEHGRYDDPYSGGDRYDEYDGDYQNHNQHQQQQPYPPQQNQYPPQYPQSHAYNSPDQENDYPDHPPGAYSRDPGQTPTLNDYQQGQGVGWASGNGGLRRPEGAQNHPGGSGW